MSGLLVAGAQVLIDGLTVLNRHDDASLKLSAEDYRRRRARHVSKIGVHSTKGIWPQVIRPGKGPAGAGRARAVARYWPRDPLSSAAHVAIDGHEVLCLADVVDHCAFHATTANDGSIGLEMCQESDGTIYEGTLENTVRVIVALCGLTFDRAHGARITIPFQIVGDTYLPGAIVARLKHGGSDFAGIFGHRDQSWKFPEHLTPAQRAKYPEGYAGRGRGDPGDAIYERAVAAGAERLELGAGEDLARWSRRQARLNLWGARLTVDGIFGPATRDAMMDFGFRDGREIDAAVEAPERLR